MPTSSGRLVVRSRRRPRLVGVSAGILAGCVTAVVIAPGPGLRAGAVLVGVGAVWLLIRSARSGLTCDADGLTARGVGGTRRIGWSQVAALGTRDHVQLAVRTTDGREVTLLHDRDLGELPAGRTAAELQRWAERNRRSGPPASPRRLARPVASALVVLGIVLALTVAAWLDAWAGLAAGAATVLTARLVLPRADGDGPTFRAVPPPAGDPAPVSPA